MNDSTPSARSRRQDKRGDNGALHRSAEQMAGLVSRPKSDKAYLANRVHDLDSSIVRDFLITARLPDMISFAGGLPTPEGFDVSGLREAFQAALGDPHKALQYGETEGEPELRESLCAEMRRRGISARADRIIVTTGSQQALDLMARLVLNEGDAVALARPSYLAALSVFKLAQAKVVGLETDADGPRLEALEQAVRQHSRLRLLYLVPDFSNPGGETISEQRRLALLRFAARHNIVVIEDTPYGELRFRGHPEPSLASLAHEHSDACAKVVYVSTLSKLVSPSLRVGWISLPDALYDGAVQIKQALDLHTSTLIQLAAANYLQTGRMVARLDDLRATYRDREAALAEALNRHFGEHLSFRRPDGGMFLWARLSSNLSVDSMRWLHCAASLGAIFVPGSAFFDADADPRSLRLSFATTPLDRIDEGVRRLRRALDQARRDG